MRELPKAVLFTAFELLLCLVGIALAYLLFGGLPPTRWTVDLRSLGFAAAASLPMLGFGLLATSELGLRIPPLRRIYEALRDSPIGEFIREHRWPTFLILSLCAGFAEEFLFRGVLQVKLGLILTSFIFGVLHALSWAYFIVATVIGFYLGGLYDWTGGNLFVPAAVHALYDFVVLLLFRRRMRLARPED